MAWGDLEEFKMQLKGVDVRGKIAVIRVDGGHLFPDKQSMKVVDDIVRYAGGMGTLFIEKGLDLEALSPWEIKKIKEQMETIE